MVMTLEADYAVRIVEYLTKHRERRDARSISEETQIPLRFALKILRELVREGMVCSFKGAKGGYTLAKSPEDITLRQVIELVEGPYMLSRCQKEEYSCGREHCRLHTIYEKISEDVRRELGSTPSRRSVKRPLVPAGKGRGRMAAAAGRKPEQHKKTHPGVMPRVCFFMCR